MIKPKQSISKNDKIAVLESCGIDASDSNCVNEFEIHYCTKCFTRFPVSAGNIFDYLDYDVNCPDCKS